MAHRFFQCTAEQQDIVLGAALDHLAAEDEVLCETLLRAVYYEEAYERIAADMGVSKGTVSKRKSKALIRMKQLIEDQLALQ